jgi:hypothetical protein
MVSGRLPSAIARPESGTDGLAPGAGGEHRGRQHDRRFSPDLQRTGSSNGTAELYLNPQNPAQSRELHTWLKQQPQLTAVLPNWQVAIQLQGWPVDAFGVIDHPTYREHWPLLEALGDNPWIVWPRTTR